MKSSILPFLILQFTIPFIKAQNGEPKFQFFTPRPKTFEVKIEQDIPITQEEEKDDNSDLIIPKLTDILSVLPSTKSNGSPRDVPKLKVAMVNIPEKVIQRVNQQFLNLVPANKLSSCPHIDALSQDVCAVAGRKHICWSPGSNDVDCPTNDALEPFGLCCFDGCQNTCFARQIITTTTTTTQVPTTTTTTTTTPPCKTVISTVRETITVTKCQDISHEVCHPIKTTICEPECRTVEVVEPTAVQVEKCEDKNIKHCRNVTKQVS